ncbi:DUF1659 domain-containing protein [Caloramator sp. mosi_1]|uniref:DUF1659 domain-containing protein n=1 Tax=Caloramator sp. mosi_1 TaxID=3023090 RepID=UPI002362C44E|nr:DUF1659 domain-containing protein [Caloramator sp. mosi_1]WDC84882.1 DUF1659 domain-containing protein [Caloramator sp. mosi_1]
MAIRDFKQSSTLLMKFNFGVDSRGNDIIKVLNLRKVKPTADHQAVYDTALSISTLVDGNLTEVLRQEVLELVNE